MIEHNYYWLKNAHIPTCLINERVCTPQKQIRETRENLSLWDLKIQNGKITQLKPTSSETIGIDLQRKIVLPCFIDLHTHLDKGHIFERSPNLLGEFNTALETVRQDAQLWNAEDLYPRMEFALQCSYHHGSSAIRTHLDCFGKQANISIEVWQQLKQKWQDKIYLQAVSLVTLDYFLQPEGKTLADKMASIEDGILGAVVYIERNLDSQLDNIFELAIERGIDLDFHADENEDLNSICLQKIAQTAIKYKFPHRILAGHCCSLSVQSDDVVQKTIDLVKQANMSIVSLPMCNLYLQGRKRKTTPQWRGVTRVKELKAAGIPVSFASDNCRDPFHGFGDHDMLEVFAQSVRIAHLDTPYDDWITSVTKTPAQVMGLEHLGSFDINSPADLIIFNARYFSELLSRPQHDRQVIRKGKLISSSLPSYNQLAIEQY